MSASTYHADDCAAAASDGVDACDCGFDSAPRGKWVICGLCRGDGHVVNPAIDAGGLSAEDFDDDPEFAKAYRSGVYDVDCPRCAGSGKVRRDELEGIEAAELEAAADRRLAAREDGDVEGWLTAGDARWGRS